MSIESPAKCEIRGVIRYLVWKGKTPVEVYNEVKTAYDDKVINRTNVLKSFKMVVRLCMMLRGAEDLTKLLKKSKMRSVTIAD